ncbi:hypothetical protein AM499_12335 [Bacillus sp. FJAT-22090]|uniref:hypothetical protein n=1 Tax=Bacillus sp. FJAT-22090 TaxID=1581038 RepID=UPI0006AE29A5|nr:hypothetical protein [Bacillus sp. FJAT-22090]ALC86525.1 hypothetical protein AM499_12335 [Bacillus sp. FJAT-22090]
MWKKAIPAIALSAFLLVGCNNNDNAAPNNNETPMEEVQEDLNDLTPDMNNNNGNGMNGTGGTNTNDNNNGQNNPAGFDGGAGTGTNNGVNDETVPNANNNSRQSTKQEIKEITE